MGTLDDIDKSDKLLVCLGVNQFHSRCVIYLNYGQGISCYVEFWKTDRHYVLETGFARALKVLEFQNKI